MGTAIKIFVEATLKKKSLGLVALILALVLLAGIPFIPFLLSPGYPITHEWLRYPQLLGLVIDSQDSGVLYPRWLPHLAGGFGMPTFVFYQFLFFFTSSIVDRILPFSLATSVWISVFGYSLLGVLGTYLSARQFVRKVPALLAAALFAFTPYAFVNLYIRGALAEYSAVQLVPLIVFFSLLLTSTELNSRKMTIGTLGLFGSLWAILMMHPLIAMPAWGLAGLVIITRALQNRTIQWKPILISSTAAFLVAFIAGSIYWYPALALGDFANLDEAFRYNYQASQNLVEISRFFLRDVSAYVPSYLQEVQPEDNGLTYQLGLPHFLLATIGAWQGRKQLLFPVAYVAYLILILLMSSLSLAAWEHIESLKIYQFPWRLLGITSFVQVICALGLFWNPPPLPIMNYRVVTVLTVCAFLAWNINIPFNSGYRKMPFSGLSLGVDQLLPVYKTGWMTFCVCDEFLPSTANPEYIEFKGELIRKPLGSRDLVESDNGTVTELPGNNPYQIACEVVPHGPTKVVINQHYFPGWEVFVNDVRIDDAVLREHITEQGLLSLDLDNDQGPFTLRAKYVGPSALRICYGAALLAITALVTGLFIASRTKNSLKATS